MVTGHPWPATSRCEIKRLVVVDRTGHRVQTRRTPTREVRSHRKVLFPRFVEAHHKSLQLLRSELCVFGRQCDFGPCRCTSRRLCPICRESEEQVVQSREVLRQAQRVRLEQELRDGEQRLEALRAEASEQRTPPAGGPVDEISQMQKLVTELNQIAAELDALSQELRRSRAPNARSWAGSGPPDLSNILPLPDDHRRVDECEEIAICGMLSSLDLRTSSRRCRICWHKEHQKCRH